MARKKTGENPSNENPIDELKQLHAEICEALVTATRMTLPKMIRSGEILTAEKAKVDHGEWMAWVKKNVPYLCHRTANLYMWLYERREIVERKLEIISNLTVNEIVEFIRTVEKEAEQEDSNPYELTSEERAEYDEMVNYMMEKTFFTPTVERTFLAVLRFTFKHKDQAAKEHAQNHPSDKRPAA